MLPTGGCDLAISGTLMGWTPPDGIDVPRWWCLATTRGGVHGPVGSVALAVKGALLDGFDPLKP